MVDVLYTFPREADDEVFCNWVSVKAKIINKQEMSQSRDECPQRNWSSIRHIRGKLAVI